MKKKERKRLLKTIVIVNSIHGLDTLDDLLCTEKGELIFELLVTFVYMSKFVFLFNLFLLLLRIECS